MKRIPLRIVTLLVAAIALASPLSAADKAIQIEKPWARASILKSRPGAAYLKIVNRSETRDRLLSVSSPLAGKVSIHLSEMSNGVMMMSPMHDLPIEPGASVTLKPGGLHLMLMKLRVPLKKGGKLPLTLNFEIAGKIDIQAQVLGIGAVGPD